MPSLRTTAIAITSIGVLATGLAVASVVASSYAATGADGTAQTADVAPSSTSSLAPQAGGSADASGSAGAQGPRGPRGATGDTGPQGPKGDTGARGATGATGPQGPQGAAGRAGADGSDAPAPGFDQTPAGSHPDATGDVTVAATSTQTSLSGWYRLTGSTTLRAANGSVPSYDASCALVIDGVAGAPSTVQLGPAPVNVTVDGVARLASGHSFGLRCVVDVPPTGGTPDLAWGAIAFVSERIHS